MDDSLFDGFRPGADFLVIPEAHRGDFAGAMTVLTTILEDGEDVVGEGLVRGVGCREDGRQKQDRFHVFQYAVEAQRDPGEFSRFPVVLLRKTKKAGIIAVLLWMLQRR